MPDLLADTYALFAAADGAPAYERHFSQGGIVTTALNLVEFATGVLRRGHGDALPDLLPALWDMIVEPDRTVVADAARFKHERRLAGARCSYVDAWGYATAQSLGIPFLTGDDDFRGVPGVLFAKA